MLNNIILIWAFNIILICLYDIDVGTIRGISWNPRFMTIQKSIPFRNKTTIIQNHIFLNCEKAFYWTITAFYSGSHIWSQLPLQPYIWPKFGISTISSDSESQKKSKNMIPSSTSWLEIFTWSTLYIVF